MKEDRQLQVELMAAADQYLALGLSCVVVNRSKRPQLTKWTPFYDRQSTPAELRSWTSQPGAAGIAVITGKSSGRLAVMDWDRGDAYDRWRDLHPALARSVPTYRTGRDDGGFHCWAMTNLRANLPKAVPGGQYFGGKHLNIAPPSRHASGRRYTWLVPLNGKLPEVEAYELVGAPITAAAQTDGVVTERYRSRFSVPLSTSLSLSVTTVLEAIEQTQPTRPGERDDCIMHLARALKFNCGLASEEPARLRGIVRDWYRRALPVIKTKDFEVTLIAFERAFEAAAHPLGLDLVDAAALRVDPQALPEVANRYEGDTIKRLISLCYSLQEMTGGVFWISTRDAAERLSSPERRLSPMDAWRLLQLLERDGVIECVRRGGPDTQKATRYRWIG
jgi:hypothetical protein